MFSDDEEDSDAFNPCPLPAKRRKLSHITEHSVPTEREKKSRVKPKHRIHIPTNHELLEDQFCTQLPDVPSSPYRIRGARWSKPTRVSTEQAAEAPSGDRKEKTSGNGASPTKTTLKEPPDAIMPDDENASELPHSQALEDDRFELSPPAKRASRVDETILPKFLQFQATAQRLDFDIAQELADLPSDAFASSSSSPQKSPTRQGIVHVSPQDDNSSTIRTNLVAPQNGLRQMTLFGGAAQPSASQANKRHNWPLANKVEPPTHHKLNLEAIRTYVYPTNLGTVRDYQYSIVARGLYHNLLVALPTGLGKTFIAATIMLNWFRWTTESQIVFVAPTKPLVSQQVEACLGIAGIPRSVTSMLTGGIAPGLRAEEWKSKRIFFTTPQTILNDLKTGYCDPKKIVLLVVDEAHRATGNYAYVELVKFLRRFNQSFRILALTATPGGSVEAVQEVIDGLAISRVEIRTEYSLDIRRYVHSRDIDTITFDSSEEMEMVMTLFSKALQPVVDKLMQFNAYWSRDPMMLTAYGLTQARQRWMASAGKNANPAVKGMVSRISTVLAGLAHSIELLKFHGIGPFYHGMVRFRNDQEGCNNKGGKYEKDILASEHFQKMMTKVQFWINNPTFVGHPKLEYLQGRVLSHFVDAGEGRDATAPPSATRVMIFAQYRDSAEEIVRTLKRNEPMIRPHVFVGQANAKGSVGMDQKQQLEIIQKFKTGTYNTLVATSIGEEGLDIGEIDLIIIYDSSASPVRMLQRMGRTGRKRAGNIVLLLMKGKEQQAFEQAKDSYRKMQSLIELGTRFSFHDDQSPRIVPREVQPVVDRRVVEIPLENAQAELPIPKKQKGGRAPKRPPKKFHMPDGVRLGFVKASRMADESDGGDIPPVRRKGRPSKVVVDLEPIPSLEEVLLSKTEEQELDQRYRNVPDGDDQPIRPPRLTAYPTRQRDLGPTTLVRHGRASISAVRLLRGMHNMDQARVDGFEESAKHLDYDKLYGTHLAISDSEGVVHTSLKRTKKSMSKPGSKSMQKKTTRTATETTSAQRNRKRRHSREDDECMEGAVSHSPTTSPRMQLPSQSISLGSDTSGEDEDDEPDSELANFIVDGEEDEVAVRQPVSVITPSASAQKTSSPPFYISQEIPAMSDDELPDAGTFCRASRRSPRKRDDSGYCSAGAVAASPKRQTRRIVDDSSSE